MEAALKKGFLDRNEKYFPEADLPIAVFYSNDESYSEFLRPKKGFACMISRLGETFGGRTIAFSAGTIGCGGGLRYSGFPTEPDPDLKFFLSCGFEGKGRGLRLKATPELVEESEKSLILAAFRSFDRHCVICPQSDRKSTRLNSSHIPLSRMPSSA